LGADEKTKEMETGTDCTKPCPALSSKVIFMDGTQNKDRLLATVIRQLLPNEDTMNIAVFVDVEHENRLLSGFRTGSASTWLLTGSESITVTDALVALIIAGLYTCGTLMVTIAITFEATP